MASMARLLVVFLLLGRIFGQQPPPYDVLIEGGRVLDGTGAPWFRADVGIRGDKVAAVGRLEGAPAELRLDARGLAVAPGFIDIHTHARRGIFQFPAAENYIRQGVTSLIEGQDGSSPLPLAPFLERLAQTPIAVNFGLLAGQGSIREAVMGRENRPATAQEIEKMKDLLREAMLQGAFGLSTGLFYVPGNYTPTEEVIELARVAARLGGMKTLRESGLQKIKDGITTIEEVVRVTAVDTDKRKPAVAAFRDEDACEAAA